MKLKILSLLSFGLLLLSFDSAIAQGEGVIRILTSDGQIHITQNANYLKVNALVEGQNILPVYEPTTISKAQLYAVNERIDQEISNLKDRSNFTLNCGVFLTGGASGSVLHSFFSYEGTPMAFSAIAVGVFGIGAAISLNSNRIYQRKLTSIETTDLVVKGIISAIHPETQSEGIKLDITTSDFLSQLIEMGLIPGLLSVRI